MLVISRRKGEKLILGRDIVITVTELKPGKVSLGIEAPRELKITRVDADGEGVAEPSAEAQEKQKTS